MPRRSYLRIIGAATTRLKQTKRSLSTASSAIPLSLFDSLSDSIQPLPCSDHESKGLAWYTCGPTTYAPAHLGHARTYVCLDIIRRILEAHSWDRIPPLFVMNITDVDDKILNAAMEQNSDPIELARRHEAEFWSDLDALNCLRPHIVTRVTEHVESHIVPFIAKLMERGVAYELDDGIYFDIRAYNERLGAVTKYGKLAPTAAAEAIEVTSSPQSAPTDNGLRKKDQRDFVLWKRKKPEENISWTSPWGDGRPGWHIECSAMIEAVQSQVQDTHRFLVHAGGVDLQFPHHTNEIAQSEAYRETGEWIPHWVHTGHLHIDGLKMSKSLKNFVSIRDFLNESSSESALESPGDDFRLWCLGLSGSYRGPATFSRKQLSEAKTIRQQILRFLIDGSTWLSENQTVGSSKAWEDVDHDLFTVCQKSRLAGISAIKNDMDGTKFLRCCLRIVEEGMSYISSRSTDQAPIEPIRGALLTLRNMLELVGFSARTTKIGVTAEDVSVGGGSAQLLAGEKDSIVDVLVQFRSSVRRAAIDDSRSGHGTDNTKVILKHSDQLRDDILPSLGIELLDGKADDVKDDWRVCLPLEVNPRADDGKVSSAEISNTNTATRLDSVPVEELFRTGSYQGAFAKYDSSGLPTHNADGSEISKRAVKKLLKKREAHIERLSKKAS